MRSHCNISCFQAVCAFVDIKRLDAHFPSELARYSTGIRECSCLLYSSAESYPTNLIGPIHVIWDTPLPVEPTEQDPPPPNYRKVLIRLHPSISRTAYKKISDCIEASFNLPERLVVGIIKYDKEFLTFEITGKRATEVVKAVLKPLIGTDAVTKDVSHIITVFRDG